MATIEQKIKNATSEHELTQIYEEVCDLIKLQEERLKQLYVLLVTTDDGIWNNDPVVANGSPTREKATYIDSYQKIMKLKQEMQDLYSDGSTNYKMYKLVEEV